MYKFLVIILFTAHLFLFQSKILANAEEKTVRLELSEDTTVHNSFPYTSYFGRHYLALGYESQNGYLKSRLYAKYNLQEFADAEIKPEQIVSASLNFSQFRYMGNLQQYEVRVFEPKNSWDHKTLNWNNQPSNETISEVTQQRNSGWKQYDITELVRKQLLEKDWSTGVGLRFINEDLRGVHYWSKECVLITDSWTCDINQTPFIEIIYTDQLAIKAELISPEENLYSQSSLIKFNWSAVPTQEYQLEISQDLDFTDTLYQSEWLESESFEYQFVNDGRYYWRVNSIIKGSEKTKHLSSDSRGIEIDRSSPNPPKLDQLLTETYGSEITLFYTADQTGESSQLSFVVQQSKDQNFSDPVSISATDSNLQINKLGDYDNYFRVMAKDLAGNLSEWSNIVFTKFINQERNLYIQLSEQYISPDNSPGIKDFTQLKIEITPVANNEDKISLDLFNNIGQIIKQIEIPIDKKTILLDKESFPFDEGHYLLQVSLDQDGSLAKSNTVDLVVDNSSPKAPTIENPKSGYLTNKKEIEVDFQLPDDAVTKFFLNDKEIKELNKNQASEKLFLVNEGANQIIFRSVDLAGNSSESKISIISDWTPPAIPLFKLKPETALKTLKGEIKIDEGKIYIYNLAGLHSTHESIEKEVTLITKWVPNSKYSFYAQAVDSAGNLSPASSIQSYTTPAEAVLGESVDIVGSLAIPDIIARSFCEFSYNQTKKIFTSSYCDLTKPRISSTKHIHPEGDIYWINTLGKHNRKLKLVIHFTKCKEKTLLDPKTWNSCVEQEIRTESDEIDTYGQISTHINKTKLHEYVNQWKDDGNYQLLSASGVNHSDKDLLNKAEIIFDYKVDKGVWLDFHGYSKDSNSLKLAKAELIKALGNGSKYFSFPFNRAIGVTQWHGQTAFSLHTGIDFGSYKEPVYAMADGYIKKAEWDSYNGSCLSGGLYIQIEHDNGMNSLYLHLNDFNKTTGIAWKQGERIKKGERLGTSGNSGSANCKPLGYHLHLEIRKDQYQKNNVDPVKWIDFDWDKVPTLQYEQYPGRLTGNNPHPDW